MVVAGKRKRQGGWTASTRPIRAYGGGVDLESDDRDIKDDITQDSHMNYTDVSQVYPSGEGDASESTVETELFGAPRRVEGDKNASLRRMARSIVVTIPKGKLQEIEAEEADVALRAQQGDKNINYYWAMGRLPAEVPERIYFLWDGAIRAYHEVTGIDRAAGRLYMDTAIHELRAPVPMAGFRGFRYLRDVPSGKVAADIGHNLFELNDSDPIRSGPANPLVSNPSQTGIGGGEGSATSSTMIQRDNVEEDPDMHLGSKDDQTDQPSTNPTFWGTEPSDGDWQYVPDISGNLTTVHDDTYVDSENRSPFVKVFRRLNDSADDA